MVGGRLAGLEDEDAVDATTEGGGAPGAESGVAMLVVAPAVTVTVAEEAIGAIGGPIGALDDTTLGDAGGAPAPALLALPTGVEETAAERSCWEALAAAAAPESESGDTGHMAAE